MLNNKSNKFPEKESYLLLNGQAGNIETLISPNNNSNTTAIICHPHPLHKGTMNNKVVYTTHKALHSIGFHTLRFNFRGVGRSEGNHDYGQGETEDLITIIKWLAQEKPNSKIILAGFSFGAFIALRASNIISSLNQIPLLSLISLISIAPAVHHQDYISELPVKCPWLVIMGTEDDIVPPKLVFDFIDNITINKPNLIKVEGTEHFFHSKLPVLKNIIINYFKNFET